MQSPGRESTTVFRWVTQLRSKIWENFSKPKYDTIVWQADLESTIKEKYNLEAQIDQLKDDISGLKEAHSDEVLLHQL